MASRAGFAAFLRNPQTGAKLDAMIEDNARVTLRCTECGRSWRVSPNAVSPQCRRCNSVDFEVQS